MSIFNVILLPLLTSLIIGWLIMGLWHGANWTFVLWGIYHSIVIVIYRIVAPVTRGFHDRLKVVGGVVVTLPVMMLAWVPFRAENLNDTVQMWSKVFNPSAYGALGMRENAYLAAAFVMVSIFLTYWVKNKLIPIVMDMRRGEILVVAGEVILFSIMVPLVVVFLRPINQFIYFQF